MVEKDKLVEMKVKHSGVFDFKDVYGFVYTWFTDNEYQVEEKLYSEKSKGDQKELEVSWTVRRKVSDYFRFIIKADYRVLRMTNVDIMKDGVKVIMNKGDFEVKFQGILERDYENRWENTAFLRFLRGIYDRYIAKSTREGYEGQLIGDVQEIVSQTKAFLSLSAR